MLGVECVHLFEDEADGVLSDLRDVRLQLLDLGAEIWRLVNSFPLPLCTKALTRVLSTA